MNRAFFFDRDGVLNYGVYRYNEEHRRYRDSAPLNVNELRLNEYAKEVIKNVKDKGFIPIVVTNQPDFLKRDISLRDYEKITTQFCQHLELERSHIFECLHREGYSLECGCRKPKPGLFFMAKGFYDLDMRNSWMIGDSFTDIEAARNAGVGTSVFCRVPHIKGVSAGNEEEEKKLAENSLSPNFFINDLSEVIKLI